MVRIQHPAYALRRGEPARATVGSEDYGLDSEGYFEVDDDTEATEAMDRLAETYGVEYDDEGEVVDDDTPDATPDAEGTDDDTAGDELEDLSHEDLKQRARDHDDVDTDDVDLRQRDKVVSALKQTGQ